MNWTSDSIASGNKSYRLYVQMTAERAISCSGGRKIGESEKRFASEIDMRAAARKVTATMLTRFERFPTADAELQTLFGRRTPSALRYHRGRRYVPLGLKSEKL